MSAFRGKTAVITGASAGLGEEFAVQLADLGVSRIVLTARRAERLAHLRATLLASNPELQVDVITADLSDAADVTGLIGALNALEGLACDILINNAGFGDLGSFESSEASKIEDMLEVNVVALTRLTHWAVPGMIARRCGWICNVGSTAGLLPLPSFAVYAATKAYVNSFSEALRVELRGSGVNVLALCPGPVETEFGEVASRANSKRQFAPPAALCVHKGDVVRETLSHMARGKGRLIPGLLVRIPMLAAESTPRWLLRLVFNFMAGDFQRERAARRVAPK
ncbi:MAG TPA: SDR family oxidoreductase [Candidatus Methylacidiphilales bacterium]|nr:SDR family oxidoreductase [Candidatus Methylacidiphilales bacterium]